MAPWNGPNKSMAMRAYRPMPGSSMLSTQQATASEMGMTGIAWCSGPCSSPALDDVAAAPPPPPPDDVCWCWLAGIVSMRGGSLMCTVRLDPVDDVRPTAECSLGSDRRLLPPPPPGGAAADTVGCWTWLSPVTRLAVTSVGDVICNNQLHD